MDPRRKKIYIILIVVCLVLSAGILVWSNVSTTESGIESDHSLGLPVGTSTHTGASGDYVTGFLSPDVFPSSDKFNTEVLDSDAFKKLKEYPAVDVTGQLGRPDPFKNY